MTEAVIETVDLTKSYGRRTVVDHVRLTVREGEIFGFLGPNGAGKTTTLRMVLGLVRPTAGTVCVLGARPGAPSMMARTGALVESPACYPYLSGRDNLRVFGRYSNVPATRVDQVLETVGLTGRAGDRVAAYSPGMKQRLGVAIALLKDPELLVLDEPSTGLDPAGMSDMRALLRRMATIDGRTVLLSSHHLGEVQEICDRVGVVQDGRMIAQGTVRELCGPGTVRIEAHPLPLARTVAERFAGVGRVDVRDAALEVEADEEAMAALNRELVLADVAVSSLTRREPSLEELFFELTDRPGKVV